MRCEIARTTDGFNSIVVRLKVRFRHLFLDDPEKFQFHSGSIKSWLSPLC